MGYKEWAKKKHPVKFVLFKLVRQEFFTANLLFFGMSQICQQSDTKHFKKIFFCFYPW